jgi:hypothetical protein
LQLTTLPLLLSHGSAVFAACCRYHFGEKRLVNSIPFLFIL